MRVTVSLEPGIGTSYEMLYILQVFAASQNIVVEVTDSGRFSVGMNPTDTFQLSSLFVSNYTEGNYNWRNNLSHQGFVTLTSGKPDYLSTAFYMLASVQEYSKAATYDALGRFEYGCSYQANLGLARQNIVQLCFDKIAEKMGLPRVSQPTRFFLSHDIDTVYESIVQDGLYVIKKGRVDIFLKMLYLVAIGKPEWLNIDRIMSIESEHDCKSTFFWLVEKGKHKALKNADYDFQSSTIQKTYNLVEKKGFESGIHKSISDRAFANELASFSNKPIANRYHFLKFRLPEGYDAVEQAQLGIDASLGFAESMGFRASYGAPFVPYSLSMRKAYSFVEVPLHCMDTTFFKYDKKNIVEAEKAIIEFFEANRTNCVLSVLWHNNFFSNYKYKGYLPLYKKILAYIIENRFKTITQQEIIDRYSLAQRC